MANTTLNGITVSTQITQTIVGTPLDDTVISIGQLTASTISGIEGLDTIVYAGNAEDTLFDGGSENDYLSFQANQNISTNLQDVSVFGGANNDVIDFGYGNIISSWPTSKVNIVDSLIRGNAGNDDIYFGEDTTITGTLINGNQGSDHIDVFGTVENSTIQGGQASDHMDVEGFTNLLAVNGSIFNGNNGNDQIDFDYVEVSSSSVFGGQSTDFLYFEHSELIDSLASGDIGSDTIYFANYGEDNFDTLVYTQNSTVTGGTDADFIAFGDIEFPIPTPYPFHERGELIGTIIDGGTGNDAIWVGEDIRVSNSTILGGDNADYIDIDESFNEDDWGGLKGSIVDGGAGRDFIYIGDIELSPVASSIYGGDGNDDIKGEDYEVGAYWDGGLGDDVIDAGDGGDTILGGDGNDIIDAEEAGDLITGGDGNDIFEYWNTRDSNVWGVSGASQGSNMDTITDFSAVLDDFMVNYNVTRVESVSSNFSTTWQNTVNAAFQIGGQAMNDYEVAVLTINSGINQGAYLLFLEDGISDGSISSGWDAENDGIIRLDNLTTTITSSNFLAV